MTPPPRRNGPIDPRSQMDDEALAEASANAYPQVARQLARREGAGMMLGVSIALLLGAVTLFGLTVSRSNEARIKPPAVATTSPAPAPAVPAPPTGTPAPAPAPGFVNVPPAVAPPAMPLANGALAMADHARAPTLVFDALQSAPPAASASPQPEATSVPTRGGTQGLTPEEQFAKRLVGDADSAAATSMDAPEATVAQGTLISAVLETAINSDLPGYVRAVISRDVRSFDGGAVLIPRGSHVIGEYKSGLAVGQTRAFVLWTRLLRPDGVSVALGSPATDSAGSNGLPGKVNSHFGKRFGAAILLSMITAGGQAAGGGNATLVIAGPAQAASSLVQHDVNIPPTVRVTAGQPIRIFVARDLDFSGILDGKARHDGK